MFFKTIIQGRLEFGTQKSYDKVLRMFHYRAENYHKSEMIFEAEDIFFEDGFCLNIPRYVAQSSDKHFRNTARLLEYCGQFAITGVVKAWLIDNGKVLHYTKVEPSSDKIAVQSYLKGKSLVKIEGKEDEAIEALNRAIEKYDRHGQAYERRGKVNFIMKKYHDAIRDYTKSIGIDAANPHAWFGRAKVHLVEERFEEAIVDFDQALKTSFALQGLYWKARRLKAKAHIRLGQWEKAAFDLKLFTNKVFKKGDSNIQWKRSAWFDYGIVLLEQEVYDEALKAFEKALEIEEGFDNISEGIRLRYRGIAKQKLGKSGYIKDIKDAAELGDKEAKTLLKTLS